MAFDGNPCGSKLEFNYEMMLRCQKLKMINDDTIKEMDRDVAQQFLEMRGIVIDLKPALKHQLLESPLQD